MKVGVLLRNGSGPEIIAAAVRVRQEIAPQ